MSLSLFRDPFDDVFFGFSDPFFTTALQQYQSSDEPPLKKLSLKKFTPILSADVLENDNDYQVHVDLPGVDKADLDISFNEGVLSISAERKEVQETKKDKFHKVERSFGKVQRSIRLPKNADVSNAQASLKDGVLTVTIGKKEVPNVHKITVA